jgi:hypothetical protein
LRNPGVTKELQSVFDDALGRFGRDASQVLISFRATNNTAKIARGWVKNLVETRTSMRWYYGLGFLQLCAGAFGSTQDVFEKTDTVNIVIADNPALTAGGKPLGAAVVGGFDVTLFTGNIRAAVNGDPLLKNKFFITVGDTLAHEAGWHGIGGGSGHPAPNHMFIDSENMLVGSTFSDIAAEAFVKGLGLNAS